MAGHPRAVRLLAAGLGLALGAGVAGCGELPTAPGGAGADQVELTGTVTADVSIAEVEPAADPRSLTGPVTLALPERPVDPVLDDPRPHLPVTITDAQGTEVTVHETDRILALDLSGTLARTVFELGLGDQVIGRDTSTGFAEAADLPLVTPAGHDLNAEAILDLDPTVIITDSSLGPWDVVLQMRDAGIPVVVVDSHRGTDNLGSLTRQVADALGVPAAGRRLASRVESQTRATVEAIDRVAPQRVQDQLRTVFLYVRGQSGVYYMFGEDSGADALIEAVGGYDVSAEIGWNGMRPVTDEGLISAQPDVIVMMTGGLESVGGVDGLLDRLPAIAETPAGAQRRVIAMDDSVVLGFGPRTPEVLNALAVALYAPQALA